MNEIKVNKTELLAALTKNRTEHREIFLEAQENYRKAVIAELERSLADARAGRQIRVNITLVSPVDQTKDYDRAIRMLHMSMDNIIELDQQEFSSYVLDDWSWKRQFTASNINYSAKLRSMPAQD